MGWHSPAVQGAASGKHLLSSTPAPELPPLEEGCKSEGSFSFSSDKTGSEVFLLMERVIGKISSATHRCERTFLLGKENGGEKKKEYQGYIKPAREKSVV